ncbi:MAG: hypothetical protein AVDCRST_MAG05-3130, partial [uncultured Rubrobacteraceae bacterium]
DRHHEQPARERGRRRRGGRAFRGQQGPRPGLSGVRLDGGLEVGRGGRGAGRYPVAGPGRLRRVGGEQGVRRGSRRGRHAGVAQGAPEDVVLRGCRAAGGLRRGV